MTSFIETEPFIEARILAEQLVEATGEPHFVHFVKSNRVDTEDHYEVMSQTETLAAPRNLLSSLAWTVLPDSEV